jgi:hypothetical protein
MCCRRVRSGLIHVTPLKPPGSSQPHLRRVSLGAAWLAADAKMSW